MGNFPLTPFLESIKDDIPVRVRDYERMLLALRGGGVWTIERLRDILLALLVKNRDQQTKFLRRFDAFFPPGAQTVLDDREIKRVVENIKILIETPKQPESPDIPSKQIVPEIKPESDSRFKWWIPVCIVLTICLGFGLVWQFQPKPTPPPEPQFPVITLEPGLINFDPLKTGKSATQTITLKNNGPGIAKLKGIEITGAHVEHFKHETESLPEQLAVNQQHELPIEYIPNSDGIHTAFLDVECNAIDSPVRAILKGKAEAETTQTGTAKRLYRNMPYVAKVEYYDLPEPSKDWIYYGCLALLFLLYAVYYGDRLRRSRRIPEDLPATFDPDGPRHFSMASVGGKRSPMLDEDLLDHLADCMGHFRSEQVGKDVDVDESVKASVKKSGIPEIVFSKLKQTRALLALEDNFAESSAWNTIAAELVNGMRRRGVPVIHGRYDQFPDKFKTEDGAVCHLEDLEDRRRGFLALIFAESRGTAPHNLVFAMERLSRWPMKAWMEYKQERFEDDDFTKRLQTLGIPVLPASSDGVCQAVQQFLTEQGIGGDLPKTESRRTPAEIPERPDALVEYLLNDALSWAQDCAMIQPIPLGLADAMRKKFHPHLPPERMARLFSLPDTVNTPSGLRFSTNTQAVLRTGFNQRRENREQEAVLRFLLDEIQKAEPAVGKEKAGPGLDHLKWEATVERLRMELDRKNDLGRFAALAKSPLGSAMIADLESCDFDGKDGKIPLRVKPENPKALQRLAELAGNPFDIAKLKAFPLKLRQRTALGMMVLGFFGFLGVSLYDYSEWRKSILNWEINGTSDLTAMIEILNPFRDWIPERTWQGKQPTVPLTSNANYQLTLFENGYSTANRFITKSKQRTRIVVKKGARLCDCKEEPPEVGLTVLRCDPKKTGKEITEIKTWHEILGEKAPKDRLMSIGLELSDATNEQNLSLSALRDTLFETGSVDILYQVRPGRNGNVNSEKVFGKIYRDLLPWIDKSQLIWWQEKNYITSFPEKGFLKSFDRIVNINVDDDENWRAKLAKVFEPGEDIVVTENEIFASLGKGEASGEGEPVALIRAKKGKPIVTGEFSASLWKTIKYDTDVRSVVFSSSNFFVWSDEVIVYDSNFNMIWSVKAITNNWFPKIAIAPNEEIFAFSYYKSAKDISIYGLKAKSEFQIIENAHSESTLHLAFSPYGKFLASGSDDKTVKIWQLSSGKFSVLQTLTGHPDSIVSVSFSPDGKFLASGCTDDIVKIWQLSSGKFYELQTLEGHSNSISCVSFSPDGKYLASGSQDHTIKIWQLSSGKFFEQQTLKEIFSKVWSVTFSPDGKFLAVGTLTKSLQIWQLSSGKFLKLQTLKEHSDWIWSVSFSPDGKFLASGSRDKTVKIWKLTGVGGK